MVKCYIQKIMHTSQTCGDSSEVSANNHSEMARVTFAPIHCDVPVFVTKSGLAFYLQKINDLGNSFYMYIC